MTTIGGDDPRTAPPAATLPPRRGRLVPLLLGLLATLALLALGTWQVERRRWKLDLIAHVERNVHAAPVAAPGPADWPLVSGGDAYRRVRLHGRFLHDRETLVRALTERGAGYWVVTPLRADGWTVLVNRGFVPEDRADPRSRAEGQVAGEVGIVGLLRLSEPKGYLFRTNDPAAGRFYSRDVAAIARVRGLGRTAPYFVDADAAPNRGGLPVGGLTVIAFANSHLVYAITWYALAALAAGGTMLVVRTRARPAR